ncbi:hypothetical protein BX257_4059 [Streptomyces sp. 3212.3]|nr:hypothetical protein BX257_4059 [Streptomyces sp. 3212.3]
MLEELLAQSALPDEVKNEARQAATVDSAQTYGLVLELAAPDLDGDTFWQLRGELIDLAVMA